LAFVLQVFELGQFHGAALNPSAALRGHGRDDVIEFFCHL
jgi:hypothetical protein